MSVPRIARPKGYFKHIDITVIPLVGRHGTRRRMAPAKQLITPAVLDRILDEEAAIVERFFPGAEFRLVSLRSGSAFNFVQVAPTIAHEDFEPSDLVKRSNAS